MSALLKYGLILGLASVIITITSWLLGASFMLSGATFLLGVGALALSVYFAIRIRNEGSGFMRYGEAFKTVFLLLLISAAITSVFSFLLFNVIDPSFEDEMKQATIEKVRDMAALMGDATLEDAMIEEAEKELDTPMYGLSNVLKGFAYSAVAYALLALLLAFAVKKDPPEDEFLYEEEVID
ncbi:MAG: DUF4199 domain-containing protein [Bernardetiaceae bacterium]|nr:DUF4199 domain-containing protein [Bernardetiaceae bacterium]